MKSTLATILFWSMLLGGFAIMAIGVAYSVENGPMAAPQLWQQKAVARAGLFAGGATSILGALGLFVISSRRRRSQIALSMLESNPKKPIAEIGCDDWCENSTLRRRDGSFRSPRSS